jgi:hypothetical protein
MELLFELPQFFQSFHDVRRRFIQSEKVLIVFNQFLSLISIKILELLLCPNFEIFGQINLNRIFLNLFDFPLKYLIFIIIEILPDFLRLLFHLVTVINGLVDVHSHQIGNRHWSRHEYFLNDRHSRGN